MSEILSYFPGQTATIFLQTLDSNGERADGYYLPVVNRLILPNLTLATGYPVNMTQLDIGLYYYQFILPAGAASVGNYLLDVSYTNPSTSYTNYVLYQIAVNAPFGNYGTSTG